MQMSPTSSVTAALDVDCTTVIHTCDVRTFTSIVSLMKYEHEERAELDILISSFIELELVVCDGESELARLAERLFLWTEFTLALNIFRQHFQTFLGK
ncbi:hypothetical protein PV325_009961 [Microctonus aethiopoides]|nr:hypothetical protein PV325_009961 [Microctonus aethiopoides]KAK0074948.1 hypothetical protein PV326_012037 [Microctonus aethiopoides]